MVINSLELQSLLQELGNKLTLSGKKESADFFKKKHDYLLLDSNNINLLKDVAQELSTCRAMAQYAGFSYAEEDFLDKIVNYSIDVLNKSS